MRKHTPPPPQKKKKELGGTAAMQQTIRTGEREIVDLRFRCSVILGVAGNSFFKSQTARYLSSFQGVKRSYRC